MNIIVLLQYGLLTLITGPVQQGRKDWQYQLGFSTRVWEQFMNSFQACKLTLTVQTYKSMDNFKVKARSKRSLKMLPYCGTKRQMHVNIVVPKLLK